MSTSLQTIIRGWISLTSLLTLGNAFQAADKHLLASKLFDLQGKYQVSGLYTRLFVQWNIMLVIIRFAYVIYYDNKCLFLLNFVSYLETLIYFLLEVFIYRSATWNFGIISNTMLPGLSLFLLGIGYQYIFTQPSKIFEETVSERKMRRIQHELRDKSD